MGRQDGMFGSHELIRIFYALKADTEMREDSEVADQYVEEIERNKQIMRKIKGIVPTLDDGE